MSMRLNTYVRDIFDIAKNEKRDVYWATLRFLRNVQLGENKYPADQEIDWKELQPHFEEFKADIPDFYKALHQKYWELIAAYHEKRYSAMYYEIVHHPLLKKENSTKGENAPCDTT